MTDTDTLRVLSPAQEEVYEGPPPPGYLALEMSPHVIEDWFVCAPNTDFPEGFEPGTVIEYEGWTWSLLQPGVWHQFSTQ